MVMNYDFAVRQMKFDTLHSNRYCGRTFHGMWNTSYHRADKTEQTTHIWQTALSLEKELSNTFSE